MERFESWLIRAATLARAVALIVALVAGAILERDVGLLGEGPERPSGSSSKLLADRAECLPPR